MSDTGRAKAIKIAELQLTVKDLKKENTGLREELLTHVTSINKLKIALQKANAEIQNLRAFLPSAAFGSTFPPLAEGPRAEDVISATGASLEKGKTLRSETISYYADLPEANGTFEKSNLRNTAAWDSLFRLEVKDETHAEIRLNENPDRFKAALQAPQKYLDPVCKFSHDPTTSSTRIQELRPGTVTLENGNWQVKDKMEIDFF